MKEIRKLGISSEVLKQSENRGNSLSRTFLSTSAGLNFTMAREENAEFC